MHVHKFYLIITIFVLPLCVSAKRPNIIIIMVDDFGYETLSCNGSASYKTPVLDNMAKKGIRFKHCYAQPLCTPSRVKLMTGQYNVRNYVAFGVLDREQRTFAHLLKKGGYKTCIAGKWQLGRESDSPQHFGFDESCLWYHTFTGRDPTGADARYAKPMLEVNGVLKEYTEREYGPNITSKFICDFMEHNKSTPFLVYYPMILTHCPFVATPDSTDWKDQRIRSLSYKGAPKYFGDMVAYTDKIVGRIVAKLEELGVADNTIILFTGDNGTDKPIVTEMQDGSTIAGNKGSTTDGGTHVPLIVYGPKLIAQSIVSDALVDFSDFLPTICEACDINIPDNMQLDGKSFYPLLRGKEYQPREWIYIWYSRSGATNKAKEFTRNQRYKLYRSGSFYDIKTDVLEKHPLTDETLNKTAKAAKSMLQRALDQYKEARPKQLHKKIPPPKKKDRSKKRRK